MKPGKTVGVYDRPPPRKWPKVVAIALVLAVVLALLLFFGRSASATSMEAALLAADAEDRAVGVVADEQRTVLGDG